MQILHPFAGSIQHYSEAISDPDRYRPDHCPQCEAKQPLTGHGSYRRTLVDPAFDGVIRMRRYLCRLCKRTVSLLPEFALPWLRFSIAVISLFLVARLLQGLTGAGGLAEAVAAQRQSGCILQPSGDPKRKSRLKGGEDTMLLVNWKTAIATALGAVTCSLSGLAQVAPPVILRIEYENGVRYVYDTVDIPAFATVPTPISEAVPTFATYVLLADVVAVNGKPAKGIFLTRQIVVNLTTSPSAGQAIADLARTNVVDRIVEIQQPDGTPIGSITTLGFDGGALPPGAPAGARLGSFAITGGTGAFLGVRGQGAGGGLIIENRNASVKEDPAKRRVNGGGKGSAVMQLIPMSRPEIITTPTGPAIAHSNDFSLVTAARPARPGEILSLFATGLGPTRPGVDPGKPFPASPLAVVNSPVDVTVNGGSAEVIGAVGYPGAVDAYQVNFRIPADATQGSATIQLGAAWINGPEVRIAVQ